MKPVKRKSFALFLAAALACLAPAAADAGGPPLSGEFAAHYTVFEPARAAPPDSFVAIGRDGQSRDMTLADFRGKVVVLNLWATWCAPCVREMPALDRLQAALGGEGLVVLALSSDRSGVRAVAPFYADKGLEKLGIYIDTNARLTTTLGVSALPTTLIIDATGRFVGGIEGAAEWDSAAAQALLRYYLQRAGSDAELVKTAG
jgi:thiol-disulfide isomerase/thioredoxin